MKQLRDVAIYIRGCSEARALAWVRAVLGGQLGAPIDLGQSTGFEIPGGMLILTPEVEDQPILGVWFRTTEPPWASHADCARAAARALSCEVLAEPDLPSPDYSDTMLEVAATAPHVERLVVFPESS